MPDYDTEISSHYNAEFFVLDNIKRNYVYSNTTSYSNDAWRQDDWSLPKNYAAIKNIDIQ